MCNKKRLIIFYVTLSSLVVFFQACKNNNTLFESLSSSATNITFTNKLEKKKLFNILYYLYYYNGAGVATGDINNDGLPDIYFAANSKGNNKLYLNKGNFKFEDITINAKVAGTADWCTGVTMADVNSDGYLDIYVSTVSSKYGLTGHNELFINNKNNTFTESAGVYGLNTSCFTTQTAFFDYDRDGDLDCYMLNQSHHPHANIVDTGNRKGYDSLSGDRLYRNDLNTASKKFTDVSAKSGIYQSSLGY
jgi:enediyne biosynthesis protein E4